MSHPIGSLCELTKTYMHVNTGAVVKILTEASIREVRYSNGEYEIRNVQVIEPINPMVGMPPNGTIAQPPEWMRPLSDPDAITQTTDEEVTA